MESLYKNPVVLLLGAVVVFFIGTSITTLAPLWFEELTTPAPLLTPYTEIEQKGRDIYVSEGCVNCHTQQVRPLKSEVARYGAYSLASEFVYDLPHQLGSRRVGPDLAREGGKRPDSWHRRHFANPQEVVPGSVMPRYTWWSEDERDAVIAYLQKLGTGIDWRSQIKLTVGKNPFPDDAQAIAAGAALFEDNCADCHGAGAIGHEEAENADGSQEKEGHTEGDDEDECPSLVDNTWRYGSTDRGMYKTITLGTEKGMPSWKNDLTDDERWQVVDYLISIRKSH